jgi:hypothetical protein
MNPAPVDCNSTTPVHLKIGNAEMWLRPADVMSITDGPQLGIVLVTIRGGAACGIQGKKSDVARALGFPVTETPQPASGLRLV